MSNQEEGEFEEWEEENDKGDDDWKVKVNHQYKKRTRALTFTLIEFCLVSRLDVLRC